MGGNVRLRSLQPLQGAQQVEVEPVDHRRLRREMTTGTATVAMPATMAEPM